MSVSRQLVRDGPGEAEASARHDVDCRDDVHERHGRGLVCSELEAEVDRLLRGGRAVGRDQDPVHGSSFPRGDSSSVAAGVGGRIGPDAVLASVVGRSSDPADFRWRCAGAWRPSVENFQERRKTMATRVAINGFGRVGRAALRSAHQRGLELEFVAVNDLADSAQLEYLLRHDSVYGRFDAEIRALQRRADGRRTRADDLPRARSDPAPVEGARRRRRARVHGSVSDQRRRSEAPARRRPRKSSSPHR